MTSPEDTNSIRLHSGASLRANGEAQTLGNQSRSGRAAIRRTRKTVTLREGAKAMTERCGVVGARMVRRLCDVKCGDLHVDASRYRGSAGSDTGRSQSLHSSEEAP